MKLALILTVLASAVIGVLIATFLPLWLILAALGLCLVVLLILGFQLRGLDKQLRQLRERRELS